MRFSPRVSWFEVTVFVSESVIEDEKNRSALPGSVQVAAVSPTRGGLVPVTREMCVTCGCKFNFPSL